MGGDGRHPRGTRKYYQELVFRRLLLAEFVLIDLALGTVHVLEAVHSAFLSRKRRIAANATGHPAGLVVPHSFAYIAVLCPECLGLARGDRNRRGNEHEGNQNSHVTSRVGWGLEAPQRTRRPGTPSRDDQLMSAEDKGVCPSPAPAEFPESPQISRNRFPTPLIRLGNVSPPLEQELDQPLPAEPILVLSG